jgi:hypothetical protein
MAETVYNQGRFECLCFYVDHDTETLVNLVIISGEVLIIICNVHMKRKTLQNYHLRVRRYAFSMGMLIL